MASLIGIELLFNFKRGIQGRGLVDFGLVEVCNILFHSAGRECTMPIIKNVARERVERQQFHVGNQRMLYTVMFLIAFYGFFRVGEIAAKTKGSVHSVLQFRQIKFLPNAHESRMAKITISEFKHNISNRPFEITIQREESQPFCPLNALIQYCMVTAPFLLVNALAQ